MKNLSDAKQAIAIAWPKTKSECLSVLGSELRYQSMIYHLLREHGNVPVNQLGMNVKMWIDDPVSSLFRRLDKRKHQKFQGGFEPMPDVVIFKPSVNCQRNHRSARWTDLISDIDM